MNRLLILSSVFALLCASAHSKEFSVQVKLVRRGNESQHLKDYKVGVQKAGSSPFFSNVAPGETNDNGLAIIKFNYPESMAPTHFTVLDPPGWFVHDFGAYPRDGQQSSAGTPSLRSELSDPKYFQVHPITPPLSVTLYAFPKAELAEVIKKKAEQGDTRLIAAAVRAAALSDSNNQDANAGGPDPLLLKLSKSLHTDVAEVKAILEVWETKLNGSPPTAKRDERTLAAIVRGDIEAASKYAIEAYRMSPNENSKLMVIADTKELLGAVLAVVDKAQAAKGQYPNAQADQLLAKIKSEISAVLPNAQLLNPQIRLDPNVSRKFIQAIREP